MAGTSKVFREAAERLQAALYMADGSAVVASSKVRQLAFGAFAKATAADWHRMAAHILRRWKTGDDVEVEDVEQELIAGAWKYATTYDSTRGASMAEYLCFNAYSRAKKWVHSHRGVKTHGNPDRKVSVLPVSLDAYDCKIVLRSEATQGDELDRVTRESLVMKSLRTQREFYAYTTFRDSNWDLSVATQAVLSDGNVRRAMKVRDESDARRAIVETAHLIEQRIAQAS